MYPPSSKHRRGPVVISWTGHRISSESGLHVCIYFLWDPLYFLSHDLNKLFCFKFPVYDEFLWIDNFKDSWEHANGPSSTCMAVVSREVYITCSLFHDTTVLVTWLQWTRYVIVRRAWNVKRVWAGAASSLPIPDSERPSSLAYGIMYYVLSYFVLPTRRDEI